VAKLIEGAVDTALHNVADLLEGYFGGSDLGKGHWIQYGLTAIICDSENAVVERLDLAPSKLDLEIGYWKWRDGEFR
jgi:hypothetical protein